MQRLVEFFRQNLGVSHGGKMKASILIGPGDGAPAGCVPADTAVAAQGTTPTVQPVATADTNRENPTARPAKKTRQPSI